MNNKRAALLKVNNNLPLLMRYDIRRRRLLCSNNCARLATIPLFAFAAFQA